MPTPQGRGSPEPPKRPAPPPDFRSLAKKAKPQAASEPSPRKDPKQKQTSEKHTAPAPPPPSDSEDTESEPRVPIKSAKKRRAEAMRAAAGAGAAVAELEKKRKRESGPPARVTRAAQNARELVEHDVAAELEDYERNRSSREAREKRLSLVTSPETRPLGKAGAPPSGTSKHSGAQRAPPVVTSPPAAPLLSGKGSASGKGKAPPRLEDQAGPSEAAKAAGAAAAADASAHRRPKQVKHGRFMVEPGGEPIIDGLLAKEFPEEYIVEALKGMKYHCTLVPKKVKIMVETHEE